MIAQAQQTLPSEAASTFASGAAVAPSDVFVFVENAAVTASSIRHAQKVAQAFGGKVVLVHVQCRSEDAGRPVDPVEWDLQRQQSLKWLGRLTEISKEAEAPCEARLLEGQCASQIQSFMDKRLNDIAATVRCRSARGWQTSETAHGVLTSHGSGVMVIPEEARIREGTAYRRILVPLDGSARAETALSRAVTLAMAQAAELMLCYVAPEPGLTEFGIRDQEAERLHGMVRKRNEQAGKTYLARVRNGLMQSGVQITTVISQGGDARRALIDVVARNAVDFVVMATHGQSGHRDVPTGDVARFILNRASVPVLLVRHPHDHHGPHVYGAVASGGVRQPTGTD